jgi:hypothetical protein
VEEEELVEECAFWLEGVLQVSGIKIRDGQPVKI